jgi:hypothetical protein
LIPEPAGLLHVLSALASWAFVAPNKRFEPI